MRILIDLQGAQTGSRYRGIGRHATALTKAIIRNRGDHEIFILLNGLFQDAVSDIKNEFSPILSMDHVIVASAPPLVAGASASRAWRALAAEIIREWLINNLNPDLLLITSLFEGQVPDNSITSIGRLPRTVKTAVVLHDLIPLVDPQALRPGEQQWYASKIDSLCRSDLLLAVSDHTRNEAIAELGYDAQRIVCHYAGVDDRFVNNAVVSDHSTFLNRMGINKQFILYVSAFEPRKNFDGLIRAFSLLPMELRRRYQLVLVTGNDHELALRNMAGAAGLSFDEYVLSGNVSDGELAILYSRCALFVCPAFREGFGLPTLEAMSCGAVVIGSNTTSTPEVIGRSDALFDPYSDRNIAAMMERALTDEEFRQALRKHLSEWSKRFNWDHSARQALAAMQDIAGIGVSSTPDATDIIGLLRAISEIRIGILPDRRDLIAVSDSISKNESAIIQHKLVGIDNVEQITREINLISDISANAGGAYDHAVVVNLFRVLLGREPDVIGLKFYLEMLNSGARTEELVTSILASSEALRRLSPRPVSELASEDAAEDKAASAHLEVTHHKSWTRDDRPRILLLKLDHIGDFIVTLDAFKLIRDTWPKAHITLVCGSWNKALAEQAGYFDSIVCCDFFPALSVDYGVSEGWIEKGISEYVGLSLGNYDLAIDFRYYPDNRVLLSHTVTKYRAGYVADGVTLDLALPFAPDAEFSMQNGARASALAAAAAWTFGTPLGDARAAMLNGRTPVRLFNEGFVVGIAPGAGNPIRAWGRDRFAELVLLLQDRGDYRFVLIGANRDRADTQFIAETLRALDVIDLAGRFTIPDLTPIFAGLDLFVGLDTSTSHMAALMGVPTICLFGGQSHVHSWRPFGAEVMTLRNPVRCSPCYLGDVSACKWKLRCMDISPQRVAEEVVAFRERLYASGGNGIQISATPHASSSVLEYQN
jgi:ADP-heptose:LPS heptosyltransferase/glycosyltransferase involved in cell wall biosynthesis